MTTDPGEMRQHAVAFPRWCSVAFYAGVYGAEDQWSCNQQCAAEPLQRLTQLGLEEQAALDSKLSLEEFMSVVEQLASGRFPGIDELSMGVYKHFSDLLGSDFKGSHAGVSAERIITT